MIGFSGLSWKSERSNCYSALASGNVLIEVLTHGTEDPFSDESEITNVADVVEEGPGPLGTWG